MRPATVARMMASGEEEMRWPSLPLMGFVGEALALALELEEELEEAREQYVSAKTRGA
jgi:hypothetical protein